MKTENFVALVLRGMGALFALGVSFNGRANAARTPIHAAGKYLDISVSRDPKTGCHYLITPAGGITPRLGADGKQLCTVEAE